LIHQLNILNSSPAKLGGNSILMRQIPKREGGEEGGREGNIVQIGRKRRKRIINKLRLYM